MLFVAFFFFRKDRSESDRPVLTFFGFLNRMLFAEVFIVSTAGNSHQLKGSYGQVLHQNHSEEEIHGYGRFHKEYLKSNTL